jgi:NADP-dependent 3-hydroxy acid dehydrogenase YdfG
MRPSTDEEATTLKIAVITGPGAGVGRVVAEECA